MHPPASGGPATSMEGHPPDTFQKRQLQGETHEIFGRDWTPDNLRWEKIRSGKHTL